MSSAHKPRYTVALLFCITLFGFLLRFYVGRIDYFVDDMPDWIRIVNDISLNKDGFYVPLFGSYHGPITVYLLKLSAAIFGESMIGWRMLHIILCTLHIVLLYALVKETVGEKEALVASLLTASNTFFLFRIAECTQETLLVVIATVLIYIIWKALLSHKTIYFLAGGIILALGMLTKETILLLVPGMLFAVFLYKGKDSPFFSKKIAAAFFLAFFMILPYVFWNYAHDWPHLRREGINTISLLHLSPSLFFLYIGYLLLPFSHSLRMFWHAPSEWKDIVYLFYTNYGYQCLNPFLGVVSLGGIFFCIKRKRLFEEYLLTIIGGVILISLLVLRAEPRIYSVIIVPSLICASIFLVALFKKNKGCKVISIFILSFIIIDAIIYAKKIDMYCSTSKYAHVWYQGKRMNLNMLSKAFIALGRKYDPTLVIFPDSQMDSLANYFTSYSKIKTIDCLPENKYLHYGNNDLRTVLIFLTSEGSYYEKYARWAKNNHYSVYSEELSFVLPSDVKNYSVRIALLSQNNKNAIPPEIRELIAISNP